MGEDKYPFPKLNTYRLHHALTSLSAVAGLEIHMLAPKTMGTMIGIAIAMNQRTAFYAHKIFFIALKFFDP